MALDETQIGPAIRRQPGARLGLIVVCAFVLWPRGPVTTPADASQRLQVHAAAAQPWSDLGDAWSAWLESAWTALRRPGGPRPQAQILAGSRRPPVAGPTPSGPDPRALDAFAQVNPGAAGASSDVEDPPDATLASMSGSLSADPDDRGRPVSRRLSPLSLSLIVIALLLSAALAGRWIGRRANARSA